jgi:hypothetical protein
VCTGADVPAGRTALEKAGRDADEIMARNVRPNHFRTIKEPYWTTLPSP